MKDITTTKGLYTGKILWYLMNMTNENSDFTRKHWDIPYHIKDRYGNPWASLRQWWFFTWAIPYLSDFTEEQLIHQSWPTFIFVSMCMSLLSKSHQHWIRACHDDPPANFDGLMASILLLWVSITCHLSQLFKRLPVACLVRMMILKETIVPIVMVIHPTGNHFPPAIVAKKWLWLTPIDSL